MKVEEIRFWIKDKSCGGYIKVDCVKRDEGGYKITYWSNNMVDRNNATYIYPNANYMSPTTIIRFIKMNEEIYDRLKGNVK
tara:strand:+ start:312 stop:554 length:243 start_codon:yes stop_codon:yes gene_type:complete